MIGFVGFGIIFTVGMILFLVISRWMSAELRTPPPTQYDPFGEHDPTATDHDAWPTPKHCPLCRDRRRMAMAEVESDDLAKQRIIQVWQVPGFWDGRHY